ncbi:NUDIX hydrolase [Agromyces seonyuensis]|uniref:NUDIX domain-containing protein n=1 Tax=Agromyces seonyuensis TaxID=2662446 RepID=A0A6I4NWD9_9MICO|nr:NUDIX domain-containing protein [Agromyces seonyuensis]MWB98603.1 NUDIX domain-containing protein [Agromyces seonyuensis]
MPTPDFILELRRHLGTSPLWLSGVTAVVVRGDEVLLQRRADNGAVTPFTGIIDPGEEPAVAAEREVLEETGVVARATRLAWVHALPEITYDNGDRSSYLDLVFRCEWVSGEPYPADGEAAEVWWQPIAELERAGMERSTHLERVRSALADEREARFER